ncbi:MAG: hypothetical protein QXL86_03060, partial [Candidatus Aenigmatarchaeota archaeon]
MPRKKISSAFEPIGESEKWEKGEKVSVASLLKRKKDGAIGISIKMGKKVHYLNHPWFGKTIWIDKDLDLPSWLDWFIKTVKRFYNKLFGKEVVPSETAYLQKKVEELTEELLEAKRQLEEAKQRESQQKELLSLAEKSLAYLEEFKKTFENFRCLIEESYNTGKGKEEEIKDMIKKHNWLLGLECYVEAKNKAIDTQ